MPEIAPSRGQQSLFCGGNTVEAYCGFAVSLAALTASSACRFAFGLSCASK
jgi:hypothetical protein